MKYAHDSTSQLEFEKNIQWTQLSHKSKPYTINILKVFLLLIFEDLSANYWKSISLLLFGDFVQNFLHCDGCWLITYIMNIYLIFTHKLQTSIYFNPQVQMLDGIHAHPS